MPPELQELLKTEARYIKEGNEAASDITRERLFQKARDARELIKILNRRAG